MEGRAVLYSNTATIKTECCGLLNVDSWVHHTQCILSANTVNDHR